jgi:CheY-like chemotaxis protein
VHIRIIHVDDEPFVLEITKEILQSVDGEAEMKGSTSPAEAIELVNETEPDCVLSDFNMPEMNGIELTKRLREHSMIPVVIRFVIGSLIGLILKQPIYPV